MVVGMASTQDEEERGIALRLLEIGFLPGEVVRVIAHGYPGAIRWRCVWGTPPFCPAQP